MKRSTILKITSGLVVAGVVVWLVGALSDTSVDERVEDSAEMQKVQVHQESGSDALDFDAPDADEPADVAMKVDVGPSTQSGELDASAAEQPEKAQTKSSGEAAKETKPKTALSMEEGLNGLGVVRDRASPKMERGIGLGDSAKVGRVGRGGGGRGIEKVRVMRDEKIPMDIEFSVVKAHGLPVKDAERILLRQTRRLDSCVDHTVQRGKRAVGKIDLFFLVGESGRPKRVSAQSGELDAVLVKCIRSKLSAMRWFVDPEEARVMITVIATLQIAPAIGGSE